MRSSKNTIRMAANFDGKSIQTDSIVDGPGLRAVIWTQGCSHNCEGCQNPGTHSFRGGEIVEIQKIKDEIKELEYHQGITFSGGDPMFQSEACGEIAEYAKSLGLNVWCYTGFTYEEIIELSKKSKKYNKFMNNIDVLVDGKFQIDKLNLDLLFRGSSNQRLIDLNKTKENGEIVLFNEDVYREKDMFKKPKMYI